MGTTGNLARMLGRHARPGKVKGDGERVVLNRPGGRHTYAHVEVKAAEVAAARVHISRRRSSAVPAPGPRAISKADLLLDLAFSRGRAGLQNPFRTAWYLLTVESRELSPGCFRRKTRKAACPPAEQVEHTPNDARRVDAGTDFHRLLGEFQCADASYGSADEQGDGTSGREPRVTYRKTRWFGARTVVSTAAIFCFHEIYTSEIAIDVKKRFSSLTSTAGLRRAISLGISSSRTKTICLCGFRIWAGPQPPMAWERPGQWYDKADNRRTRTAEALRAISLSPRPRTPWRRQAQYACHIYIPMRNCSLFLDTSRSSENGKYTETNGRAGTIVRR